LPTSYKQPIVTAVACSFLAHLAVIFLIQTENTLDVEKVPPVINVVQAKLYFYQADIASEIETQAASILATNQALATQIPTQKLPTQQTNAASRPNPVKPDVTVEAKILEQAPVPVKHNAPAQDIAESTLLEAHTQPSEVASSPAQRSQAIFPDSLATMQLQTLQQQQIDRLAAEAAQSFRQDQAAALIQSNKGASMLNEEEQWRATMTKNIDCSASATKTFVVVSGLFGGLAKCTQLPAIDTFIQRRLNKDLDVLQGEKTQRQK
jgi:hypothetical protein